MIPVYSSWLTSHGKLWYDDKWYRLAWIVWPQALALVAVLWFWAMPSSSRTAQWAKPVDPATRASQLLALRDSAKSNKQAMDSLERDARGGEALAEFFYGTLFDPDLKMSTIVQLDSSKAMDWYGKAAAQGNELALNNLANAYYRGVLHAHGRDESLLLCAQTLQQRLPQRAAGQGRLLFGRSRRHACRHDAGRERL